MVYLLVLMPVAFRSWYLVGNKAKRSQARILWWVSFWLCLDPIKY